MRLNKNSYLKQLNKPFISVGCITKLACLVIFLSLIALLTNAIYYQYPGNNYFPPYTLNCFILLIIINLGLYVYYGKQSVQLRLGMELLLLISVMTTIALATNAIQYTPFPTIDSYIVQLESYFHINMITILEWTNQYPRLKSLLNQIYDTLPYQMCIIPLIPLAMGRIQVIRNYCFLLLSTTLIGFGFYYFFPTTAPASIINSPLFTQHQLATALKFKELHQYISPSTIDGGMIALPSFHVIWALLCLYLLKDWPILFFPVLVLNTALIISCVLLGWHYPIDIVMAIIIVVVCYYMMQIVSKKCRLG